MDEVCLIVRDMEGRDTLIEGSKLKWTVRQLKEAYQNSGGQLIAECNLIFRGRQLQNADTLGSIDKLQNNSIILAASRQPPQPLYPPTSSSPEIADFKLFLRSVDGSTITIEDSKSNWTILQVKEAYQNCGGFPVKECKLVFRGRLLDDEDILSAIPTLSSNFTILACRSAAE